MIPQKHIGFTGTQKGMSFNQKNRLWDILNDFALNDDWHFHHGDCIGSDETAHIYAYELGYEIIIHPPINNSKRAFCKSKNIIDAGVTELEPKEYLERNHDIVDAVSILIVAPETDEEQLRSGTWATYRYAKKKGIQIIKLER